MKKKKVVDAYARLLHKQVDAFAILEYRNPDKATRTQDNVDRVLQEIRITEKLIPWSLGVAS
jgi:hypothetical protein